MDPLILKPNLKLKWTGIPIVWRRGDPVQLLGVDVAAVHIVFFVQIVCMLTCRWPRPNLAPQNAKRTLLSKSEAGRPLLATRCVLRSAGLTGFFPKCKLSLEPEFTRVHPFLTSVLKNTYIYIYIWSQRATPSSFLVEIRRGFGGGGIISLRRNHGGGIMEEESWLGPAHHPKWARNNPTFNICCSFHICLYRV